VARPIASEAAASWGGASAGTVVRADLGVARVRPPVAARDRLHRRFTSSAEQRYCGPAAVDPPISFGAGELAFRAIRAACRVVEREHKVGAQLLSASPPVGGCPRTQAAERRTLPARPVVDSGGLARLARTDSPASDSS
jgi:hypothetical protein